MRHIRCTRHFIAAGKGRRLEWINAEPSAPGGILFVPPLIGGNGSQQVRMFRSLVRGGMRLITFSYAGHAGSSGIFSIKRAFSDTKLMLDLTRETASRTGLTVSGLGACFSAMPLIHAAVSAGEPLHSLVFINPISEVSATAVMTSFAAHYGRMNRSTGKLMAPGPALSSYLDILFPGIEKGTRQFGILKAGRAGLCRILSEFLLMDPLAGLRIVRTPALCLYAREDPILQIFHRGKRAGYENNWRRLCPRTSFRTVPGGHYMASADTRRSVLDSVKKFLSIR